MKLQKMASRPRQTRIYVLKKGDTFIIPATMGIYRIKGKLEIIETSIVKEKK